MLLTASSISNIVAKKIDEGDFTSSAYNHVQTWWSTENFYCYLQPEF
jgi:hypothetical protein